MDRDLPEGVVDADPPGGWDGVGDAETAEQDAAARRPSELVEGDGLAPAPDGVRQPDDPVQGEEARQAADPDLTGDRGEEP